MQYLRIIRSLPYGNSIFFTVKVRNLAWPSQVVVCNAAFQGLSAAAPAAPAVTHPAVPSLLPPAAH